MYATSMISTSEMLPKITLVTPSYNQGEFIEETICSVITQDYPNLEYIIIDGGSTDNTIEIIKKYESSITYWISEPDKGQADAINKGFEVGTGELLGYLNSDDLLYPGSLAKMAIYLQENPDIGLVYGDVDEGINNHDNFFRRFGKQTRIRKILLSFDVSIPQQGSLWRRKVYNEIGGFNSQWRVVLDRDFFVRCAQNCNIKYVEGALGFFRYHNASKSCSYQDKNYWLIELPLMYEQFFSQKNLTDEVINLKKTAMTSVYFHCLLRALRYKDTNYIYLFLLKLLKNKSLLQIFSILLIKTNNNAKKYLQSLLRFCNLRL